MNDSVEQETYCVDKNVPLLALDLLARIVAVRINARPPYMGRLKSSANSWFASFYSCQSYWRWGGDRPTPIDPTSQAAAADQLT